MLHIASVRYSITSLNWSDLNIYCENKVETFLSVEFFSEIKL